MKGVRECNIKRRKKRSMQMLEDNQGNVMTRIERETMNTDENRNKTCRRMPQ